MKKLLFILIAIITVSCSYDNEPNLDSQQFEGIWDITEIVDNYTQLYEWEYDSTAKIWVEGNLNLIHVNTFGNFGFEGYTFEIEQITTKHIYAVSDYGDIKLYFNMDYCVVWLNIPQGLREAHRVTFVLKNQRYD